MPIVRRENSREISSMRDFMDRFFDEVYSRENGLVSLGSPSIDLYQTDDEVIVKASLPGIKPEDLHLTVTGEVLTLQGEFKDEQENTNKNATYHIRERRYGSFSRSISLPAPVEVDQSRAEFEDGILTLTLPKAETVRPKMINIKTRDNRENK
jgi:HSP20 family protein